MMTDVGLRRIVYLGTSIIVLDKLQQAAKSKRALDYIVAGGIAASLALQVRNDRQSDSMKITANLQPQRLAPVGFIAGVANAVAGSTAPIASAASNPSIWSQIGQAAIGITAGVGTAALGAWASKEIMGGGGGSPLQNLAGTGTFYQAPQENPQASGISPVTVGMIAIGGVLGVGVLILALRR